MQIAALLSDSGLLSTGQPLSPTGVRLPAKRADGPRGTSAHGVVRGRICLHKSLPQTAGGGVLRTLGGRYCTCNRGRGKRKGQGVKKKKAAAEIVADSTVAAPKPPNTSVIYEQTKNVCRETYFASLFFRSSYRASFVFFFPFFFFFQRAVCQSCRHPQL